MLEGGAVAERLEILEEENRQLRDLLAPAAMLPAEWRLTAQEATLFRHLLSRQLVTNESAMAALYGFDAERDPKIVDVFICKLRAKLKRVGVTITTFWGQGYQLEARRDWRSRLEQEDDTMQGQAVTITIDKAMYAGIERRAASMSVRPAEYARRLFNAAYHARVAQERDEVLDDRELDRQVRLAFLLADCEPEFIAEAIGIPKERAAAIVAAWRKAGPELLADRLAPPAAAAEAPPADEQPGAAVAPPRKSSSAWPDEMVETVRTMWAAGAKLKAIAAAIGKTEGNLSMWASKHRDVCPPRVVRR